MEIIFCFVAFVAESVKRPVWYEVFVPGVPLLVTDHSSPLHLVLFDTRGGKSAGSRLFFPPHLALRSARLNVSTNSSACPLD